MWKPERTNGFQYMVRRDGEEISIDIDGSPPSQDGYPGGDQRSIINYHSHQQTPHPVIQSQLPRPAFQSQTPRLAFQSQRPAFQSQPPRAAIQSQPPRAAIQSQPPHAAIQSQPPRAAIQSQPPRPVIRSQPPLPAIHSQHPRLAMHSLQGPPPAQSLPKQHPTTRNSETFRTSRYKGGIPGITQFITVGNKSVKFSEIIFNSGKDLLEEIITRSAGGLDVTPYSTASHLERLNTMYPTTLTLDPKIVSIRIQSFMKLAKEKVDDSMRTGQGMRDDELYDQDVSREQTIVDLLKDAKRSTTPLNSTPSTTNSLSSLICNPWVSVLQRLYYSGYIRHCSNKILVAVCPMGLFVVVTPVAQGRRHDMAVAIRHYFYPKLRRKCIFPQFAGRTFGDAAFTRELPVFVMYNPSNTDRKKEFNNKMAEVRITVEWGFKIVKGLWPSIKYVPRQKIMQGQTQGHGNIPGKNLFNCFWLTNLHSCYERGNQIGDYFSARLPSVETYLGVPRNSLD